MRKTLILTTMLALFTACGPRQVEVRTAASTADESSIHFTNNLSQAVNVYVTTDGKDLFIKQVAANTTENLAVRSVPSGTTVKLKAVTLDGGRTYAPAGDVTLSSGTTWRVP